MRLKEFIDLKPAKKQFINISSLNGGSPETQLDACLQQLLNQLEIQGIPLNHVLKQTVFLRAENNNDFFEQKVKLIRILKQYYGYAFPPVSFVGQPPENEKYVALEVILLTGFPTEANIIRVNLGNLHYTVLKTRDYKEVYAAGLTADVQPAETANQADEAFKRMKQILDHEKMSFADIVRQWNYIENILEITSGAAGEKQNYQLFNDVRSNYYQTADFIFGYPAATGIGMDNGGVILDFIAISGAKQLHIVPIKNPRQIDAHKYSKEVLVGNALQKAAGKTSPKFERAKAVIYRHSGQVYISGTAAILGQNTIPSLDVAAQTETTISNMETLVTLKNLKKCGIPVAQKNSSLDYIRVYVKAKADIPAVKQICEARWGKIPAMYLVSDVCRDNLLVEIEGVASIL